MISEKARRLITQLVQACWDHHGNTGEEGRLIEYVAALELKIRDLTSEVIANKEAVLQLQRELNELHYTIARLPDWEP